MSSWRDVGVMRSRRAITTRLGRGSRGETGGASGTRGAGWLSGRLADAVRDAGEQLAAAAQRHGVAGIDGELTTADGLTISRSALVRGERHALPDAREEVWVVLRGGLRFTTLAGVTSAEARGAVHVPENTPGYVEAAEDTELVRVSVLAS